MLVMNRGSLKQLLGRIPRNVVWHDCFGKAAELGFYSQLGFIADICLAKPDELHAWRGRYCHLMARHAAVN